MSYFLLVQNYSVLDYSRYKKSAKIWLSALLIIFSISGLLLLRLKLALNKADPFQHLFWRIEHRMSRDAEQHIFNRSNELPAQECWCIQYQQAISTVAAVELY